ncbi:MAG: protein kinase, partial [Muribaculaceae bacterium]|nr:protein kinase [Muribaculaceae bacterium]
KEAQKLATLSQHGIVRILDIFEENNTAYYVMDYIEGKSLADIVNTEGKVALDKALGWIKQVGDALTYIHSHRLTHLDVKPANIMIDQNGDAILIDFGQAKQYDDDGGETSTTPIGISHGYAPPEQYRNGGVSQFSPQSDIYALGATLYKLITGVTPPDAMALIDETLTFPPGIPQNICSAITTAMSINKKDRHQSVEAFIEALSIANSSTTDDSTVISAERKHVDVIKHAGSSSKGKKKKSNKPIWLAAICAFIIAAAVIGVYWGLNQKSTHRSTFGGDEDNESTEYRPTAQSASQAIQTNNVADIRYYAEHGDAAAAARMGDIYRLGLYGVTDTLANALSWYEKAFNLGDVESAYKLGTMYQIIRSDPDANEKSLYWLRKASEGDYVKAWYVTANKLRYDDKQESYKWASKAEQAGDIRATAEMAQDWYNDLNPSIGENARKRLYDLACSGNTEAVGQMAWLCANGYYSDSPRNYDMALPWAQYGESLNDPTSLLVLGWYYFNDNNEKRANEYFKKAADLGDIVAMWYYGGNTGDYSYDLKRMEALFNGDAVLFDGLGVGDYSKYANSETEKNIWTRRAVEYGW